MVQLKKGVLRFAADADTTAAPVDSGARDNRGLGAAPASKGRAGDALDKQIERRLKRARSELEAEKIEQAPLAAVEDAADGDKGSAIGRGRPAPATKRGKPVAAPKRPAAASAGEAAESKLPAGGTQGSRAVVDGDASTVAAGEGDNEHDAARPKKRRKKVRSRQKNIRKDNRPLEQRPEHLRPGHTAYKGRPLSAATKEKMGLPPKEQVTSAEVKPAIKPGKTSGKSKGLVKGGSNRRATATETGDAESRIALSRGMYAWESRSGGE